MNRPNIKEKAKQIDRYKEQFIGQMVRPYLIQLLNQVQTKLKHPIKILVGNGMWLISYANKRQERLLTDIFFTGIDRFGYNRITKLFPELVEINEIMNELLDELNMYAYDITPTVCPKNGEK